MWGKDDSKIIVFEVAFFFVNNHIDVASSLHSIRIIMGERLVV